MALHNKDSIRKMIDGAVAAIPGTTAKGHRRKFQLGQNFPQGWIGDAHWWAIDQRRYTQPDQKALS